MKSFPLGLTLAFTAAPCILFAAGPAAVDLRSAAPFTILAGQTITTNDGGPINGNVGLSPGTGAAIHLTAAQVNGTIYAVDATGPTGAVIDPTLLTAAKGDLKTAYNDAKGREPTPVGDFLDPGAGNLGGLNLAPGLYKFTGTAAITGSDLTLSGGPDDVWIFQIASGLQVEVQRKVILIGGAQPRNIFWQVGSSAVIGAGAEFKGTILADQSVTMDLDSVLDGRAFAFEASVTYDSGGATLPTPETPYFTAISRSESGAVTLTLVTTPHFPVTLQTSTNLEPDSWTLVTTETPVTSPWIYTHNAMQAIGPKRFYRAFVTPYPAN